MEFQENCLASRSAYVHLNIRDAYEYTRKKWRLRTKIVQLVLKVV